MWWNSVIQRLTHYYSNRLHQPHCAVLPCSTLFLPSHSPKRPLLLVTTDFCYFIGLCSEAKKCLYFIMGNMPRLTSKCRNFSKCYVVNGRRTLFFQKSTNAFLAIDEHFSWNCFISVDEHFSLLHKISTDAFLCFISVDEHFFLLHKISTDAFLCFISVDEHFFLLHKISADAFGCFISVDEHFFHYNGT